MWKQILLFALDNALKHSTARINVAAKEKGASVEIPVRDFGEGIPPETLERIFDRVYRGEGASPVQSFGLGLPIAKAVVDAQGTGICVESAGKGVP